MESILYSLRHENTSCETPRSVHTVTKAVVDSLSRTPLQQNELTELGIFCCLRSRVLYQLGLVRTWRSALHQRK